jgi:type VI protein secretion system component VasF
MDHQAQKAQAKKRERKEAHRHEMATETTQEQKRSKGTRTIHPLWFGALGFVLAVLALLRWMAIF